MRLRPVLVALAAAAIAMLASQGEAQSLRPCNRTPLQSWFNIGEQCQTRDGRICTLISVKGDRTGNWSCTRGKGKR